MAVRKHIIPGEKFGKLTVLHEVPSAISGGRPRRQVSARCDCGVVKDYVMAQLRSGMAKSCGCIKHGPNWRRLDIQPGTRWGRLTCIEEVSPGKRHARRFRAQCDCGNVGEYSLVLLRDGRTKSCGCLMIEHAMENVRANTKHGLTGTPTWNSYMSMIGRCCRESDSNYYNYGGRGIKVCERWMESFENFLADMGKRPDGLTLDRYPDVNGDYEPGNCRWATDEEQANNKRTSVLLTANGKTQTLSQWAREVGISSSVIFRRRSKGMTPEQILQPLQKK